MNNPDTEYPWSPESSPELDQRAKQTITASLVPDADAPVEIQLGGHCPRCRHSTAFSHPLLIVVGVGPLQREELDTAFEILREKGLADTSSGDVHIDATCQCSHAHTGRPDGESGCGAQYVVHVVWP